MIIKTSAIIAMAILIISQGLSFFRLILGKSLPDRVVALNHMGMITTAMALVMIFFDGNAIYLDVALATLLIVFWGTIMVARYIKRKENDR